MTINRRGFLTGLGALAVTRAVPLPALSSDGRMTVRYDLTFGRLPVHAKWGIWDTSFLGNVYVENHLVAGGTA